MKKSKAIIFGTGRFAEYVYYVLTHDSSYAVSAFCIESSYMDSEKTTMFDLPILKFESLSDNYDPVEYSVFIAVGNNRIREKIFRMTKEMGFTCLSYVSSKASCWQDLKYGENVLISENTVIQPFVTIGDNSVLFGARIGHHSYIEKNILLSGCTLAGNVRIGDNSFLGLNSSVKENVSIGLNNIIGMGSIITQDTGDSEIYHMSSTRKREVSKETKDQFEKKFL